MRYHIWQSDTVKVVFNTETDKCYLWDKERNVKLAEMVVSEIQDNDDVSLIVDTLIAQSGLT